MNPSVLLELAKRWEREAIESECSNGAPEAERQNAIDDGIRRGKSNCAADLRNLIKLLA